MPPSRSVPRSEWIITSRRELEHSDHGHNSDHDGDPQDGDALRFLETLITGNLDFSDTEKIQRKKSKIKTPTTISENTPQGYMHNVFLQHSNNLLDSTLFKLISTTPVTISLEREPSPVIMLVLLEFLTSRPI